jgi:hypothetical protein
MTLGSSPGVTVEQGGYDRGVGHCCLLDKFSLLIYSLGGTFQRKGVRSLRYAVTVNGDRSVIDSHWLLTGREG